MESLTKIQLDIKLTVTKGRSNFKKSPKERITISYIEARLENLETQWKVFSENHRNIVGTLNLDEYEKSEYCIKKVYELTEELYYEYKAELKEGLNELVVKKGNVSQETFTSNIKLPKISLPMFSGNYADWCSFKDLFISLIHSNVNLDNVQKLHYLKTHLIGEAEQLLKHISVTEDNYVTCWEQLQCRYNNKRYLANCVLDRFLNQKKIVCENSKHIKELLDVSNECLNALKNLKINIDSWDIIVIHLLCLKLDNESRKLWECKISNSTDLPAFSQFKEFLEQRFRSLEFLDNKKDVRVQRNTSIKTLHVTNTPVCEYCTENHKIANCKSFARESHESRQNFVQTKGLCFNCLGSNHSIKYCRQTTSCRICKRRHHSLLHPNALSSTLGFNKGGTANSVKSALSSVQASLSNSAPSTSNVASHFSKESVSTQVLLATALVEAQTRTGSTQLLRVLLDQGSQASFITESAVQLLGLKRKPAKSVISGVGGEKKSIASEYTITVTIHSHLDPKFSLQVHAYVLGNITTLLPSRKIIPHKWPMLETISLADPEFNMPNKVDILLGAEAYGQVLKEGLIQGPPGLPVAQNTALGWILFGKVHSTSDVINCHHVSISSVDQADDNALLKRFWEIESVIPITQKGILSEDELRCEEIYSQTTRRDETGSYIVKLPFRNEDPQCQYGNSRSLAIKRFLLLENRLKKNPELAKRYGEEFHEYIHLGHMERVPANDPKISSAVYLPHHAVVRDDKSTTKVRIVFDASMKGLNGRSLNDDLMVGPPLQSPLRHIIMRWRMHPISICADIIKMYRQVKVAPEDTDFQRVVWRDDPASEIKEYKLLRVTFGTASAPYLAVKTLQKVADDEGVRCPEVAETVKNDFYVDDLMTGCQTVQEGLILCQKISELLTKGGFQLQKWVSSCKLLHKEISKEGMSQRSIKDENNGNKDIKFDEIMKILGISWDREYDEFKYLVNLPPEQAPITKRRVISDISRLFDPLGWAAPCVITSKIFIQKLWLSGLDWDEELTPELMTEWQTYRNNLIETKRFSVPRWVFTTSNDISVELHGFCDASVSAYAAVVYLRVVNVKKKINISLITSRTKVAPVKQQSIPRLELMGAVLLAELISEVAEVMKIPQTNIHVWTDSTVVLAWLSGHPSRWTTFVGNRVSTILSYFDNTHWAHVESSHNPADIASRGLTPQELSYSVLWAQGPLWLKNETIEYSKPSSIATNMEQRSIKTHIVTEIVQEDRVWTKFSTLSKLVRVIAYCRRVLKWKKHEDGKHRYETYLEREEIDEARRVCIRHVQNQEFIDEIRDIRKVGYVKTKSKLKALCPFIDNEGILRVSGRIDTAKLEMNAKHPVILPHNSHFTNLVVDEAHKKTLHGGPTLMLSHLRTKYWIISAKTLVRAYVRKCVTCKRYSAATQTQLMGQLPACRVTPARPFRNSGVDFAGPVNIRTSKGRGHHSNKGYICIFVCMASKAIHLEAISDLSSQGFIAGFKRFVSRRGVVSDIWSDNGTNFVGASKELRNLVAVEKSSVASDVREWLSDNGTAWHFIPPHAPNFGGLWEAGVKSTKYHLRRVIGDSTLTYEEMATVLTQVEACLNSRPLSMMPDTPEDLSPLTPGHFLIGEPILTVPDRNYEESNVGNLRRWQFTQRMVQEFWRRWSEEYLSHLIQRYKWNKRVPEPNIGDIVLIKEDGLPPARWLMGKIIAKHPGHDKVTRVVTLKCKDSVIKRPTSKLCILPVTV